MSRQEAIRAARLAAAAIILVVTAFLLARIGHHPATSIAGQAMHPAMLVHRHETRTARRITSAGAAFTLPSAKGTLCALTIPNGQVLQQNGGLLWTERANSLKIENRSGYGVILKLRDMMLGRMRVSLFVAKNSSATYDRIPEGRYIVDYALGNALDESCSAFPHLVYAGQLGLLRFAARDAGDGKGYDLQEVTIPPPDDRDAGLKAIGKNAFDFD
jgi:hypothetical protein